MLTNTSLLAAYWGDLLVYSKYILIFLCLEYVFSAQKGQSLIAKLFNVHYMLYYLFLNALLVPPLLALLTATVQQYPNLFGWVQTGGKWSIALHVLAYLLAYDFCYYWYHRVQHRLHIGWRIHRLHHSDKALNVTTAARHHWLEEPLKVFAVSVPLAFIFDLPPLMVGWFAFAFGAWGFFIHSNLRVGFGPLQYLLVSPQSHRVHHSDQPQHLDKNFAAIFPIWDLIFGTFYRVTRDEYPTTGLNDHADYHSVASAVLSPVVEPKASEA